MRLREFEPPDGYILCFSGGKDSTVLKALADEAGVKYEAHYHVTTMDPPPVIRYMRRHHPDVIFDKPVHGKSFAQRLERKAFPLRQRRWCCEEFKERSFPGRVMLMGMRAAERRASGGGTTLVRVCRRTGARAVQPVFDWSDEEVWSYIRARGLPYCELYDEGWTRIGCVCCPFTSTAEIARSRERWPAMFRALRRGLQRRWNEHLQPNAVASVARFASADELFDAWLQHDWPKLPSDELWPEDE